MLGLILLILATGGLAFLWKGAVGQVVGWEPYCSACGFCLAGLKDTPEAKCPECGRMSGSPAYVKRGRRQRNLPAIVCGVLLLIAPVFWAVSLLTAGVGIAALDRLMPDSILAARFSSPLGQGDSDSDELFRRLQNDTLSAAAIDQMVVAMADHVLRGNYISSNGAIAAFAGEITGRTIGDQSIGWLAQSLRKAQEVFPGPLVIQGVTTNAGELLATPGISQTSYDAVVDLIVSICAASCSSGNTDLHREPIRLGGQVEAALRSGDLTLIDFKRILEAAVHASISVQHNEDLWRSDTVQMNVILSFGAMTYSKYRYSRSLRLRDAKGVWSIAGSYVDPTVRRQDAQTSLEEIDFLVTLPDTPGRHTLSLEVDLQLHELLQRGSGYAAIDSYVESPPGPPLKPLLAIRIPCQTEIVVQSSRAATPDFVLRDDEPNAIRPLPWNRRNRRDPIVWSDLKGTMAHVSVQIAGPEIGVAYDIWLRHGDREVKLGWLYCPAGEDTFALASGPFPGLKADDQVEIVLRPAPGILRRPRGENGLWGGEIVVPAEVTVPGRTISRSG